MSEPPQPAPAYPPQPPYHHQPYPPPAPPNRRPLWIALGVLALAIVLGVVAVTGFVAPGFFLNKEKGAPAAPSEAPYAGSDSSESSSSAESSSARPSSAEAPAAGRVPLPKRPSPLPDPSTCAYPADAKGASRAVSPPAAGPTSANGTVPVTLTTSAGEIGMTLDRALAPCAVANFVSLVQQGFYQDTSCHRLGTEVPLQMLQCGDPGGDGSGGPGYTIPDELFPGIKYGRGIVAMAKTQAPDSGGSQFFMIFGAAELPPEYTVFGSISDNGLRTLDQVADAGVDASTGPGDGTGKPNLPVTFENIAIG